MNPWIICYRDFNLSSLRLRETLFTLGNGYFATRGALEDSISKIHYPGTYLAGGFNRITSKVAKQTLVNEDLVNQSNWLPLSFKIEEEEWFDITQVELLDYREMLHLKKGLVKRFYRCKDIKGRVFIINSLRFVSQHDPHLAGIRYSIISENWSAKLSIRSSICGEIKNRGVARYADLNNQHLEILKKGGSSEYIYLQTKTSHSHIEVSEVIKTEVYKNKIKLNLENYIEEEDKNIHQYFNLTMKPYEKVTVYKTLAIYHSKDYGICENLYDAIKKIKEETSFHEIIKRHIFDWSLLWNHSDIQIESTKREQKLIRFHIFHTLQSISQHSVHLDYGAPARGLHGEAYRGHVFWDEIFILPFFFFSYPEIARSLLMYRYYRLNSARKLALECGYQGVMFPWQSASNGEEETQRFHLNPKSHKWGPDFSCLQRHVNMAIVYNIWNYYSITQDFQFLKKYGAEIILEIAKFISSIVTFNENKNKYEIIGVMGPDEFHEFDLSTKSPGLKNNAYTNFMAVWVLEKALELRKILSPSYQKYLFKLLNITQVELERWENILYKMYLPFHNKILSQF
ncbi:MAG: glycoside hydrolase family 65 protein, partial [Legionella longbeachae]|nr:glycoside hydrolase family 65 protein [Legionella longbeachae]